jgi:hypothetical protein
MAIHEGGEPYVEQMAVFHVARTMSIPKTTSRTRTADRRKHPGSHFTNDGAPTPKPFDESTSDDQSLRRRLLIV